MLGGNSTPDNYNAQRASSLYVREPSKKALMSEQDAGAMYALRKRRFLSCCNFSKSNLLLTAGL
jgi:hypothetical protein